MKESKFLLWVLIILSFPVIARSIGFSQINRIPPAEDEVMARLNTSPRHGEWVSVDAGNGDTVDAWLVFPERHDNAPVVMVIHEIYGLTDWVRAVADQLAAEGFIAVAPDLLSGKGPGGKGSYAVGRDDARSLIRSLEWSEIVRRLDATARYATSLPAATSRFGAVGYCWGGGISFNYATAQPDMNASVVYYGVSPSAGKLAGIKAPVLGLYGGDDNRVTSTVPAAEKEMKRLGKRYEYEIYKGAGHAFLRNQSGRGGANLKAAQMAWPRTIKFLKELLES
jgi:carboxymethylenebutenolidase